MKSEKTNIIPFKTDERTFEFINPCPCPFRAEPVFIYLFAEKSFAPSFRFFTTAPVFSHIRYDTVQVRTNFNIDHAIDQLEVVRIYAWLDLRKLLQKNGKFIIQRYYSKIFSSLAIEIILIGYVIKLRLEKI